jgi:hypothetical protein
MKGNFRAFGAFCDLMKSSSSLAAACLTVAALALSAAPAHAEKVRNHFDTDSIVRPPGFFDFVILGAPGPARWLILTDPNPPSAPNRLVQVETTRPADSIAAVLRRNYAFQDGTVSTFVKKGAGREGLILRLKDERNFLLLMVDPVTGKAVLSSYAGGKATELGRGQAALARPWEQFSVTALGPELSVLFNDQKLFGARDPKPVSGRTGLATAGPGEASFDEFLIEFEPGR